MVFYVMSKMLYRLIMDERNIDSMTSKYNVNNVGIIDEVVFIPSMYQENKLKLFISSDSISDIECKTITHTEEPVTFFEAFGFNRTFRRLFDEIEKSTVLSKKEISELIRHNTKCFGLTENDMVFVTLCIKRKKIVEYIYK